MRTVVGVRVAAVGWGEERELGLLRCSRGDSSWRFHVESMEQVRPLGNPSGAERNEPCVWFLPGLSGEWSLVVEIVPLTEAIPWRDQLVIFPCHMVPSAFAFIALSIGFRIPSTTLLFYFPQTTGPIHTLYLCFLKLGKRYVSMSPLW